MTAALAIGGALLTILGAVGASMQAKARYDRDLARVAAVVQQQELTIANAAAQRSLRVTRRSAVRVLMPTPEDSEEWASLLYEALTAATTRRARWRERRALLLAGPGALGRAWMRQARTSLQRALG